MNISPDASFDILYIGNNLMGNMGDFSKSEIQFFSYFSCLLSIYDGKTLQEWDYDFVKTDLGIPYSLSLDNAFDSLIANNLITSVDGPRTFFKLTENGCRFLEFLNTKMTQLEERRKYLSASCSTIELTPLGHLKDALGNDPVIQSAKNSLTKKTLLLEGDPATNVLYSQLTNLRVALRGKYDNLIVPAMVWIESLDISKKFSL